MLNLNVIGIIGIQIGTMCFFFFFFACYAVDFTLSFTFELGGQPHTRVKRL